MRRTRHPSPIYEIAAFLANKINRAVGNPKHVLQARNLDAIKAAMMSARSKGTGKWSTLLHSWLA